MTASGTARLVVQRLNSDGEGVARLEDGLAVFVPGALPGEEVDIELVEVKKTYARGRLVRVRRTSPERVAPSCVCHGSCGGCSLGHLSYDAQLVYKRQKVVDALERLGKFEVAPEGCGSRNTGVLVHPVIPSPETVRYRNKLQLLASHSGGGRLGFCRSGTNEVVDFVGCQLVSESMNRIASRTIQLVRELGIPYKAWPDTIRSGRTRESFGHSAVVDVLPALRHVIVREAGDAFTVVLVVDDPDVCLPDDRRLEAVLFAVADALAREFPSVRCVAANLNSYSTSDIPLGARTIVLSGDDHIVAELDGLRFSLSPTAFAQVNAPQTVNLYRKALEYARLTAEDTVLDLYCGAGTISLFLARQVRKVIGVEVVYAAVHDAIQNARLNGLPNAEFLAGPAEALLPRLVQEGIRPTVVVMDPPRKGCELSVIEAVGASKPQRVVYVSCDPASLARDLARFRGLGYETVEVQPVDMFPQTAHVECVALIEKV